MESQGVDRRGVVFGAAAIAAMTAAPALAQAAKVKVGINYNAADLPYFIAQEMGLFKDEGLDVELINFKSTTEMMAPPPVECQAMDWVHRIGQSRAVFVYRLLAGGEAAWASVYP